MTKAAVISFAALLALAGCDRSPPLGMPQRPGGVSTGAGTGATAAPEMRADSQPYSGIGAGETVRVTGTEPFWSGQVAGTILTYSTPDDPAGDSMTVKRFAGRAGVSWSGIFKDQPFTLAVTEGKCSDGMSDRTYPFTATLRVQGEQRQGCAWSDRRGIVPPTAP